MSIQFLSSISTYDSFTSYSLIKKQGVASLLEDPSFNSVKESYYDAAKHDWIEKDYSMDFGKLLVQKPQGVMKPKSQYELLKFIELANKHGIRLSYRAQGHSNDGQVLCSNIVIDLKEYPKQFKFLKLENKNALVVSAHATWKEVLDFTLPYGLTVPVLTDYLKLSLGGTLNIGGLGGNYKKGSQADNVSALHILTFKGEILFCSKTENVELFNAALCSLGQIGIILDVTLPLIECKKFVECRLLHYRSPEQFFKDQRALYDKGLIDHLKGYVQNINNEFCYMIEASVFYNNESDFSTIYEELMPDLVETKKLSYTDFVSDVTNYVDMLDKNKKLDVPHPWYGVLLSEDQIAEHLKLALASPFLANGDPIIIYPINAALLNQPFFIKPHGKTIYLLNMLYNCSLTADANMNFSKVIDYNKTLYWDATKRGGCCYPPRIMPSMHDWELHFGKMWHAFCEMKTKYDPNNIRNLPVHD